MSITKEKDRSLIFCTDGDFKRRITNLLIEAAFPAEKYTVSSVKDAKIQFDAHSRVVNIIMNGADFEGKKIFMVLNELRDHFLARDGVKILIYLSDEQYIDLPAELKENKQKVFFFQVPVTKIDLNSVFNPIKQVKHVQVPGTQQQKSETPTKNVNFIETSKHLQETIDSLNSLSKNRSDLEALLKVGQRFNGLFGAFSFVADKPGYKELNTLAHIIDDIARHYESGDKKEIGEDHFNLMLESAKCSFSMLQPLRDNKPLGDNHLKVFQIISDKYAKHTEIKRRSGASQQDVDDLLKQAGLEEPA